MPATRNRRPMGKKRSNPKLGNSPSHQFTRRLRALLGDRTATELAQALGITPNAVGKWLRGERTPPMDDWPAIAKALGLDDWRDLLPPRR